MLWWLVCIRILSNKTINEIMPNIEREYTLTQTTPIEYESIDQCLISELLLPKEIIQGIIDEYRSLPNWTEISNKNLTHIYKDESNPMTEDEKFAIYLYSVDSFFYNTLSQILNLGTTGQFNCYFQYLRSGFDKIKTVKTDNMTLYRGIGQTGYSVHYVNYKPGDIVHTTSFTSTSTVEKVAYQFSGGMLFKIQAKRNPKSIMELSHYPTESELLYPPVTKFVVTGEPYESWCFYDRDDHELYCAGDGDSHEFFNQYMVVPLEEIDEDYGPILTAKDERPLCNTKYKKVDWWGWMLIGLAIGIVASGLIALVVILIMKNRSSKINDANSESVSKSSFV